MKKLQSYRIEEETIKKIDTIAEQTLRSKANVIEIAIKEYYEKLQKQETA